MVLKCVHYITHITLNVSQTGSTVASQLEFELGSLVWRTSFLPTKPSGSAFPCIIEEFVEKTAIVHFFEIEIKYDSKGKFHAENDGNISFL